MFGDYIMISPLMSVCNIAYMARKGIIYYLEFSMALQMNNRVINI
jgi:hypothetical protein